MIKQLFLTLVFSIGTLSIISAQITSGHIKYDFNFTSKDPSQAQVATMFKDASMDLYFATDKSKAVMDMGMMQITVITNGSTGKSLMLMGGMAGNIAVPYTVEEAKEMSKDAQAGIEITYSDETQVVAGYKCKKAVATDKDGNKSTFWYSEDFKVVTEGQQYFNTQIPGATLKFEVEQNGMKIVGTAVEVSKKLTEDSKTFFDTTVPAGYQEMTMEQLKSMGM